MQIVRRLAHVLIIVLTLVVGATAAAVIVSQTAWFKNWLRGYIVREANQYLNGTLSIERLGGNLFFGVEMENIGVSMDGSAGGRGEGSRPRLQRLRAADQGAVGGQHPPRQAGHLPAARRRHLVAQPPREEGAEPIARARTSRSRSTPSASPTARSSSRRRSGRPASRLPKRFDHLDAKLSFKYEPVHYSIEITHVSFRGSEPALALNALSGGVSVKDDTLFVDKLALRTAETSLSVDGAVQHYLTKPVFNLQISSDKLSLPEIARLMPALAGVRLQPAFELKVSGPMDRLDVAMNVRSSAGQITGQVVADILAPGQSVAGDISVRHLDLAPILKNPRQKTDLTADAHVDMRGEALSNVNSLRGTLILDSQRLVAAGYTTGPVHAKARISGRQVAIDGRAAAYGAAATVAGAVTLPDTTKNVAGQPIEFDLRGLARHVDLRKMPRNLNVPPAATDVNAEYHAAGSGLSPPGGCRGRERSAPDRSPVHERRPSFPAVDRRGGADCERQHRRLHDERRRSAIAPTRPCRTWICSASASSSRSRRSRPTATRAPSTATSSRTAAGRRRRRWSSPPGGR